MSLSGEEMGIFWHLGAVSFFLQLSNSDDRTDGTVKSKENWLEVDHRFCCLN